MGAMVHFEIQYLGKVKVFDEGRQFTDGWFEGFCSMQGGKQ